MDITATRVHKTKRLAIEQRLVNLAFISDAMNIATEILKQGSPVVSRFARSVLSAYIDELFRISIDNGSVQYAELATCAEQFVHVPHMVFMIRSKKTQDTAYPKENQWAGTPELYLKIKFDFKTAKLNACHTKSNNSMALARWCSRDVILLGFRYELQNNVFVLRQCCSVVDTLWTARHAKEVKTELLSLKRKHAGSQDLAKSHEFYS